MARIRMLAAILSILTILVAAGTLVASVAWPVVAAMVSAAVLLAAICPFDAPDRGRRTVVALACLAYALAIGVATILAHLGSAPGSLVIAQVLLAEAGLGLAGWALATRKRRRLPGSSRYYDNA